MSVTTHTVAPVTTVRIPEGRQLPDVTYGAHVSIRGADAYYVRIGGSPWVVAQVSPGDLGEDEEIISELEAVVVVDDHDLFQYQREAVRHGDDETVERCLRALRPVSLSDLEIRNQLAATIVEIRCECAR